MKGLGNVRRLLYHEEVSFLSVPNQTTLWKWRWRYQWMVMVVVQGWFSGEVLLKGKGRKRYKELVLVLVRSSIKGR